MFCTPNPISSLTLSTALTLVLTFLPSVITSNSSLIDSSTMSLSLGMLSRNDLSVLLAITIWLMPLSSSYLTSSRVWMPPPVIMVLLQAIIFIMARLAVDDYLESFRAPLRSTKRMLSKNV